METKKRKFEIWGRKIKKEKDMVRDDRQIKRDQKEGRVVKIDQEGRKGDKMK